MLIVFGISLILLSSSLGAILDLDWPHIPRNDGEVRECRCASIEECREKVDETDILSQFPSHKECDTISSMFCEESIQRYSNYIANPDFSINQVSELVASAWCLNRCLKEYVGNKELVQREQEAMMKLLPLLGRINEDMGIYSDTMLQASGMRQNFTGFIEEQENFHFPGFNSFLSGFVDVVRTVNSALSIAGQIAKETEQFLGKMVDLVNTEDEEKFGPFYMINLQAGGMLLADAVRSNSLYHKKINRAYFKYFQPQHNMTSEFETICLREITFAQKLYENCFYMRWDNFPSEQFPTYSLHDHYYIHQVSNRMAAAIQIKTGNVTSCDVFTERFGKWTGQMKEKAK